MGKKNKYIVLGNGFSIDIINKLNKNEIVNLSNLFSKGSEVTFPKSNEKGFLSAKYCPNLWALGVTTTISSKTANELINNIITCANVYNLSKKKSGIAPSATSIYISAYFELTSYLRYLFIYYNTLISDEELKGILEDLPLIDYIKKSVKQGYKINIITYNYDILLERLLKLSNLNFCLNTFEKTGCSIEIFKPHGSISFSFATKLNPSAPFKISTSSDDVEQEANNFQIKYEFDDDFPIVNSLIPPAGDSERTSLGWIGEMRKNIELILEESTSSDELIITGISYWHVDRNEIDDILTSIDCSINTKYINPYPNAELNAVLSSIFKNYIHHSDSKYIL